MVAIWIHLLNVAIVTMQHIVFIIYLLQQNMPRLPAQVFMSGAIAGVALSWRIQDMAFTTSIEHGPTLICLCGYAIAIGLAKYVIRRHYRQLGLNRG
jgi:hypothetical protein